MHRLGCAIVLVPLASVACVTPSQSLGAAESTGAATDTSSSAEGTTGDPPMCAPDPAFTCTAPYGGSFGECGGADFDANCCLRPTCGGDEDCADGESCLGVGISGLSCEDAEFDGETVCSCSADPGGVPRKVCMPSPPADEDWCAVYGDEEACTGAAPMDVPPTSQFCAWLDVTLLEADVDNGVCQVGATEPRCITVSQGTDPGCGYFECTLAPSFVLGSPAARTVDGVIEVFGVDDQLCAVGTPVGGWLPASDPSFGPCAFDCGGGPCSTPFAEYVAERGEQSKDAPVDDCGHVTLEDPIEAWQAAHDCAVDRATTGVGFTVIGQRESVDSIVEVAFIGLQGEAYATARLYSDSGGVDPDTRSEQTGTGLLATFECVVTIGELCLELVNPGDSVQICPPA
jgi:hypothetical protein